MSSIDKLLIRGIRSFAPDGTATITFFSPLTLIVGHNGSGKTTIIECLKYATTGDMPPNSKGGAFIHDPKISGVPVIKAQVKLKFHNVNHRPMIATRSMSLSVKKTTYTQKTLDSILFAVDLETGESTSLSTKCSELDVEVPNHLGVTRAILDNVIFCHQEESNWPLSEPAVLKKKFDDIFASTKYTSALDSIKTIRKNKAVELKLLQNDLEHIRRNKDKAEKVKSSLEESTERIEQSNERIKALDEEIEQISNDINDLMAKIRELQSVETTMNAVTHELGSVQSNMKDLEGTFSLYTETDSELQEMRYQHTFRLENADQERAKQEKKKTTAMNEIQNLQATLQERIKTIGELKAQLESNKVKQRDRDQLIRELSRLYTFDGFDNDHLVVADVKRFIAKLERYIRTQELTAERVRNEIQTTDNQIRSELADKKAKLDMASTLQRKSRSEVTSAKAKLHQQNAELIKFRNLDADSELSKKDLAALEARLVSVNTKEPSLESKEVSRSEKLAQVEGFETEMTRLQDESSKLIKHSGARARLELQRKELRERSDRIAAIMMDKEEMLASLLNSPASPETLGAQINELLREKNVSSRTSGDAVEDLKRKISTVDAQIETTKSQLARNKRTYEEAVKKVRQVCENEPLPQMLQEQEQELTEFREQVSDVKSMSLMYSRFIAMAEKKTCCPLCTRGFEEAQLAQFTAKLKKLMQRAENSEDEVELAEKESKVQQLRSLVGVWEQAQALKSNDIPDLESKLTSLNSQKSSLTDEVEALDVEHAQILAQLDDLRQMSQTANTVTDLSKANRETEAAIRALENELSSTGSTRTTDDVQVEYDAIKQKLNTTRQAIATLGQEIASGQREIQQLEQKIREARTTVSNVDNSRIRMSQVKAQINEIEETIARLEADDKDQYGIQHEMGAEVEKLTIQLRRESDEGRARERDALQVVSDMQKNLERVLMYTTELERVDAPALMRELSRLENLTESVNDDIEQRNLDIMTVDKQMQILQRQLSEVKELQRNIDDNLRFRRHQIRARELEAQLSDLRKQRDAQGQVTYNRQLQRLNVKQSDFSGERSGLKGELRQLEDRKRGYEHELSSDYKNVLQDYQQNLIKFKTIEMGLADLEKYAKALQSAIVSYHSIKMEEINKAIKELWTNTYQGTDIDTIEIRSDQEGLRANQSYNYRVVMVRQGQALDMRGRCSAGQKILASIIIRLALAESFSVSCGILALDEPTTNLDRANIESLAVSLNRIIARHRNQANFQLVIITHDEAFLQLIGLSDYADHYYRISKDSDQFSTVTKHAIEDQ